MERYEQFRGLGAGVLGGPTLAGLFVAPLTSISSPGCSIWLLGLDSGTVPTVVCGCSLLGLLATGRFVGKPPL